MTSDNSDQSFRNVLAALTSQDHGLSGDIYIQSCTQIIRPPKCAML